jgi:NADP-dependent 3-hydroxy acid dehydrogenase YdfG
VETLKALQIAHPNQCSVLQLDVTDTFDNLSDKAKVAVAMWGRVDVLVNNAGHGLLGIIEEAGCVSDATSTEHGLTYIKG